MKRLTLTISLFFVFILLKANPIMLPQVNFSELNFDKSGNWVLELEYSYDPNHFIPIDSIFIKSSTGIAKIKRYDMVNSNGLIIVRNDSLLKALAINPSGDSISIIYYLDKFGTFNDVLVFGNFPNSVVGKPKNGQSIAKLGWNICIDKSPTIGSLNDSTGMCGTINGKIYDMNNNLLKTKRAISLQYPMTIDENSNFSTRILSCNSTLWSISYIYNFGTRELSIINIPYQMIPDSTINNDIHLLAEIDADPIDGISFYRNIQSKLLIIHPNPVQNSSNVNYEINAPIKSTNCMIVCTDVNGNKVAKYSIREEKGILKLPSTIPNGMYILHLFFNGKTYCSSKLMVVH